MNIKQKFATVLMTLGLLVGASAFVSPAQSAFAADGGKCETSILPSSFCKGSKGEGIFALLNFVVDIMTAGVGILAIGGIVYAAILYASAADNSSQVQKAKGIIGNVVVGLIAFALMWSFLQFIIPGGVF